MKAISKGLGLVKTDFKFSHSGSRVSLLEINPSEPEKYVEDRAKARKFISIKDALIFLRFSSIALEKDGNS